MAQIKQADVIIIAANWRLWSAQRLAVTIRNINIKSPQKLFIVGRKSFGKINLRHYLRLSKKELIRLRNPVFAMQEEINQTMKQNIAKAMFVNLQSLICKNEKDCPVFTPQAKLISFDGGHLTNHGARYIGQILLKTAPLNQL